MSSGSNLYFRDIYLRLDRHGAFNRISDVREASKLLLEAWPVDDGDDYLEALDVCWKALNHAMSVEVVRKALIAAAFEAGLTVSEVDPCLCQHHE